MQSEVMRKTCFARQKDLREINEFFSVWWSEFSKFTAETSDRINPNRWKARGLSFPPMSLCPKSEKGRERERRYEGYR